jgi:alcohol dehydrogenase class IV
VRRRDGVVLVVADAAVLHLGLAEPALASLRAAGYACDLRPGVAGEPAPETVRALAPDDPDAAVAAVVAIGGGSALDAAKLVSLAYANDLDLTAGLGPAAEVAPGPPILAIPTTAGTGAEATTVAMLWHDGGKRMFVHALLVPRIAILDADLLAELPPTVTAAGGLDAISHAAESLLSTFRTPLSEVAAKTALGLLAPAVPAAFSGEDPAARDATLLGAFQAGLALNASVVLGHSLAYVVAARAGLPHGVSCAMALPYCLAHARPAREAAIVEIAGAAIGEEDPEAFLRWLVQANATMGIPASLSDVGIEASALADMARECVESYPRPNHPRPIDVAAVHDLLEHFHAGAPLDAWDAARSIA